MFGNCDPDAEVKVMDWDYCREVDIEEIGLSQSGAYVIGVSSGDYSEAWKAKEA